MKTHAYKSRCQHSVTKACVWHCWLCEVAEKTHRHEVTRFSPGRSSPTRSPSEDIANERALVAKSGCAATSRVSFKDLHGNALAVALRMKSVTKENPLSVSIRTYTHSVVSVADLKDVHTGTDGCHKHHLQRIERTVSCVRAQNVNRPRAHIY
jgi:hypothetical protein